MDSERDDLARREEFVSLLMRHNLVIRAYLRSMLPTSADVDDVMQEVSIAAWRGYSTLSAPENFRWWLGGIARNHMLRFRRAKARNKIVMSEKLEELIADEGLAELDVRKCELDALEACVQKLPEKNKTLIFDVYAGDQSMKSIAEVIGKTPEALYQIISRVRRQLIKCIQEKVSGAY